MCARLWKWMGPGSQCDAWPRACCVCCARWREENFPSIFFQSHGDTNLSHMLLYKHNWERFFLCAMHLLPVCVREPSTARTHNGRSCSSERIAASAFLLTMCVPPTHCCCCCIQGTCAERLKHEPRTWCIIAVQRKCSSYGNHPPKTLARSLGRSVGRWLKLPAHWLSPRCSLRAHVRHLVDELCSLGSKDTTFSSGLLGGGLKRGFVWEGFNGSKFFCWKGLQILFKIFENYS